MSGRTERFCGFIGHLVVAGEDGGAAHADFATWGGGVWIVLHLWHRLFATLILRYFRRFNRYFAADFKGPRDEVDIL